jgi:hypothetical protein
MSALLHRPSAQRVPGHGLSQLSRLDVERPRRNNVQLGRQCCAYQSGRVLGVKMAGTFKLCTGSVRYKVIYLGYSVLMLG